MPLPLQNNLPHFLNIIQSAKLLLESMLNGQNFKPTPRQGGGTQRERNWVKKSGIIERRKRHRREREKGKERKPALLRNVRKKKKKKKIVGWRRLASGSRHILLFASPPPALQQPLRSFFLCFFFFESVPAVGFVRSSLFSLFATNKPHRNISLSSRPYDSDVLTDCKKILIIILLFLSSS